MSAGLMKGTAGYRRRHTVRQALILVLLLLLIAGQILKEIRARLNFLISVGLGYLTLSRHAATLSGGESQRIRLATQIGSGLNR